MFKNLAIFSLAAAAFCAVGCNKASGDKVSTTNTTSAEMTVSANAGTGTATVPTPDPTTNDYASTVRREQITLKSRLDDELGSIDRHVADLRRAGQINSPAAHELIERRQTLDTDAQVLARSDERGWDELKATVEHDLETP